MAGAPCLEYPILKKRPEEWTVCLRDHHDGYITWDEYLHTLQVRQHREGQQRQYGLADRARLLGFTRVVVIDDDLGTSGTGKAERPGFGRLLTAVLATR